MKRNTVRIAGKAWHDVCSDVNWQDYGGVWARPAGKDAPGLWYALRYDEGCEKDAFGTGWGPSVTIFEIHPDKVSSEALAHIGYPEDECDDYGEPLPLLRRTLERIYAAVSYGEGRVEEVSAPVGNKQADRLRAVAARYAMGDYIDDHPFRFSPL